MIEKVGKFYVAKSKRNSHCIKLESSHGSWTTYQLKLKLTNFNLSIFSIFPPSLGLIHQSYYFWYSKNNSNHLYLKVTFILSKDCILYQVVIQLKSGFCSTGSSSCTIISHHFSSRIIFILLKSIDQYLYKGT